MFLLNFETLLFLLTNHQLQMRSAHSKIRISLSSVAGKGICGKERFKKIPKSQNPKMQSRARFTKEEQPGVDELKRQKKQMSWLSRLHRASATPCCEQQIGNREKG